jgi:membrane protein
MASPQVPSSQTTGARRPEEGRRRRRLADRPGELSARSWLRTLRRTGVQAADDHLLQRAAALAFFAMLSLFPALLALVSLLGVLGTSAVEPLIENVSALAPGVAREIALDALRSIQAGDGAGTGLIIGLSLALWSASAYVGAFIPAANAVWEVDEERPLWRKLVLRLVLTVVLLLLISLTALLVVVTGPIAREVGGIVGLGEDVVGAWQLLKWPFLGIVLMSLVSLLFWASPNVRHPSWRWVTPGGVLAVALWIAASAGFSSYVSAFGSFGETYGGIGGVLVFLLWLWLSNIAILLGAELNAELERTRAIEGGMRPVDRSPFLPLRHRA